MDSKLLSRIYDFLTDKLERKKIPDIELSINKNKTIIFKAKWYSIHFYYYVYEKKFILLHFKDIEISELIERIFHDLNLYLSDTKLLTSFCQGINNYITEFYPEISKNHPTLLPSTHSKSIKNNSQEEKGTDISEVSDHQLKTDKWDLEGFYHYLRKNQDAYGIWISTINRKHNINPRGKLAMNGVLFQKLVDRLDIKFSNKNGWATPIKNKDNDNYFSFSIHRNGTVRLWVNKYLSWELFLENFKEELKFLSIEEFKELIECLRDSEKKQLFFLETANLIGPRDIIERDFKNGCLVYKNVYHLGVYHPVLVKIDFSEGDPEIEYQGPEAPTQKLQDLTVNAYNVSQYIGRLEYLQGQNIDLNSYIYNDIRSLRETLLTKNDLLSEFSELNAKLFGLDIKDDLKKIINNQNLEELRENLKRYISAIDSKLELNHSSNYKDVTLLYELIHTQGEIQRIIYENLEDKSNKLLEELKENADNHLILSTKFNKDIYELLDSAENKIINRFKEINKELLNQFLIKLNALPNNLLKEIFNSNKNSRLFVFEQFNNKYKNKTENEIKNKNQQK